jgi:hypothetical protein
MISTSPMKNNLSIAAERVASADEFERHGVIFI